MVKFERTLLPVEVTNEVAQILQQCLVDAINLALQLKQAHWCVVGNNFRSVHLQLDEIIVDVHAASDEIAERIATLGVAPDGRSTTVAEKSTLAQISEQFQSTKVTVTMIADQLSTAIGGLRDSIKKLGELDPVSEDLLIAISGPLEKHLWMVQSQEL